MPRSKEIYKKKDITDPVYHSKSVGRFINRIMLDGKKAIASRIIYHAMGELSADPKEAPQLLDEVLRKVMPEQEVRSRRVGGATYQVPMPVRFDRAQALAMRWLIAAAKAKKGRSMEEKLAEEFKMALKGEGDALKKREQIHKMADANKAFAHFKV